MANWRLRLPVPDGEPEGPALFSALGPDDDHHRLVQHVLAYCLRRDVGLSAADAKTAVDEARDKLQISAALEGVLRAVDTAKTVIVEHNYFCLDARSEEALSLARQYRFNAIDHERLHFFSSAITLAYFEKALTSGLLQDELQSSYLGYTVLRENNTAQAVGRTMVSAPKALAALSKPQELELRVRTRVTEHLTLAGIPLCVRAVPFMQQDGGVTRCAHVAAWSAHYTAVLRGLVPRIAVADLYGRDEIGLPSVLGRQYPSPGLSEDQLAHLLKLAGLPPEIHAVQKLEVRDRLAWHHRGELTQQDKVTWQAEAFTTTICRYLNSGFPVLLATDDHVVLICGYLRASHMKDEESSSVDGISHFIYNDDRSGPYGLEEPRVFLKDASANTLLLVPLPRGLSLPGHMAEYLAAEFAVNGLANAKKSAANSGLTDLYTSLDSTERLLREDKRYAVRAYATNSGDYKRSFARRCHLDTSACFIVASARLPKYVWVTEIIDRDLRTTEDDTGGSGPVIGEVVVDGTAIRSSEAELLLLQLPGALLMQDQPSGYEQMFECTPLPHQSGRWAHDRGGGSLAEVGAHISKTCGVDR